MAFQPNDRVGRLTIIRRIKGQGKFVVRCECGSPSFEVYSYSLNSGRRRACEKCQRIEKDLADAIARARANAEKNGKIFHEPGTRPKWEYVPTQELPEV
jgi:hypothetical protein